MGNVGNGKDNGAGKRTAFGKLKVVDGGTAIEGKERDALPTTKELEEVLTMMANDLDNQINLYGLAMSVASKQLTVKDLHNRYGNLPDSIGEFPAWLESISSRLLEDTC